MILLHKQINAVVNCYQYFGSNSLCSSVKTMYIIIHYIYSLFFVNRDKLTPLVSLWSLKKLFALDPEVFCGINMVLSTATFSCETQQSMTNISLY